MSLAARIDSQDRLLLRHMLQVVSSRLFPIRPSIDGKLALHSIVRSEIDSNETSVDRSFANRQRKTSIDRYRTGQWQQRPSDCNRCHPVRPHCHDDGCGLAASGAPFLGHRLLVVSVCCSPDGRLVATTSLDGTARLWSAETGESQAVLEGHTNWVNHATFSADGRRVRPRHP